MAAWKYIPSWQFSPAFSAGSKWEAVNEQDYIRLKDSYILDTEKMKLARKNMIVLHPLPRVNEITPEVDNDPRAAYFKQVKYGMYARMALIAKLTGALSEWGCVNVKRKYYKKRSCN